MGNYTELDEMLEDKNHHRFKQQTWEKQPYYIREDNTIYRLQAFYAYDNKDWLDKHSPLFKENCYKVYIPVAKMEIDGDKKTFIGYIWERANMANYLLNMSDSDRKIYYPNLIWCDVGNHPYPKDMRCYENWNESGFNKSATKLVYPDHNISKAVRFPSLLGLLPVDQ